MHKLYDLALEPRLENTDKLYVKCNGNELSFNTYFNAIPIAKIKKYTAITELIFELEADGKCEANICTEHKVITSQTFDTSEKIAVSTSDITDGALLLFPVVRTKKLRRITVLAESESIAEVSCALIICTYKREAYVTKNVNYLTENLSQISDFDCKVIVVDNGRTLAENDFATDTALIPNPNIGGSGGFSRGMQEAVKTGGFTHLLLMDDDVEIDFAVLQKTLNFLRFLKPEYADISISGSMLYLDKPTYQFEAGGHFYDDGTQKGFGHFLDLSQQENLIANEADNDINYGGWWYMCMPVKYAQESNFPLPFFLKYDDVEYALRCKQRIITLNGVGVWHEKFESKYNSASEYYNTRNYLHLCNLHCKDFTKEKAQKFVSDRIKAKTDRQQYKMAKAVRKGYEDYLKGIDWLEQLDQEANHREVCKLNYEYISYDEIEKKYGIRPQDNTFYPAGRRAMLKSLLPRKWVFTDMFHDKPFQYRMAKCAVHCDSQRNMGYVTEKK